MEKLLITIVIFFFISCNSSKQLSENKIEYKVDKIESLNNWNIIYLSRGYNKYKLVSLKTENKECHKIKEGKTYNFILHSRRENPPIINGIKLEPVNYLDLHCYAYDNETEICIEPEKGINDLYSAENLNGLCIE
ncbi:hypothetical protein [Empedobacter brevis]|uniref:hypothetical protein n=1 Tax=Empedobacter brevis TaxID=247 RepID=UPI002FE2AE8A